MDANTSTQCRRGRFIAPIADLSALRAGADKSAMGAINRPLHGCPTTRKLAIRTARNTVGARFIAPTTNNRVPPNNAATMRIDVGADLSCAPPIYRPVAVADKSAVRTINRAPTLVSYRAMGGLL